jgi:hypothetical protein
VTGRRATAAVLVALGLAPGCAGADTGQAPPSLSRPLVLSPTVGTGQRHMGIRLLGAVELDTASIDGQRLGGLSGLAWDADESLLYAVSDRGRLFHLEPRFQGGQLVAISARAAYPLLDRHGRPLSGPRADAEALVVRHGANGVAGDSELSIAFERVVRIADYSPDGRLVRLRALPKTLLDDGVRGAGNRALESLAEHPVLGLLSAPERPLGDSEGSLVGIYALDGGRWSYPLRAATNASLVDLEALPDGALVTLERAYGWMYLPVIISLRHTRPTRANAGERLQVHTLAVMDSSRGWSVDNFEALARHSGMKFFLASDDNFHHLQKTILVYLEVLETTDYEDSERFSEFELRHEIAP